VARHFASYSFWLTDLNQFNGNFVQAEMLRPYSTQPNTGTIRLSLEIKAHRVTGWCWGRGLVLGLRVERREAGPFIVLLPVCLLLAYLLGPE